MTVQDLFETAVAVLVSLGGGGAIVLAFSSWLGNVWAKRLMARETEKHERELEKLRADLKDSSHRASLGYSAKLELYKEVSGPLIALVTKSQIRGGLTLEDMEAFELSRLASTSLLALFAPRSVFDQYNDVIDYLYDCVDDKATWSFQDFRLMALRMLSGMRRDIGLFTDDVAYTGHR